jgi:hypothetical protein
MQDFEKLGVFYLGRPYDVNSKTPKDGVLLYDSRDLLTHAVSIGMTGSGKTGLCVCLLEEAVLDGIPAIVIDPKGDITNLLLTFPELKGEDFAPWINQEEALKKGISPQDYAVQQAQMWEKGLNDWGQDGERVKRLRESADFNIYTPGSSAGIPVSILKTFSSPASQIIDDEELLQERVSSTATSILGLLGIATDPIRSREHILISTILLEAWKKGENLNLSRLIQQIQIPPMARIGVLDLESFYPSKERFSLAMQLNNLLAAPSFQLWREGEPLDINQLLHNPGGKPQVSIFYIAHLSDAERMFFVSLLLNQIVSWMRTQTGTTSLRAILYMDEIFGYLPPTANPPSKRPLLTLLKQARAFGVGLVLATQNPVDLDYKGLSNTGTWFIGRLQAERDKARVLDGLEGVVSGTEKQFDRQSIDKLLTGLEKRIFLMHNVNEDAPVVFETRWAMSYLRGPLTRNQIKTIMDPIKAMKAIPVTEPPVTDQEPTMVPNSVNIITGRIQEKPVLSPDIPQYFIQKIEIRPGDSGGLVYHPMILGIVRVHFKDSRMNTDTIKDIKLLAPITNDPLPVNWDNAMEISLEIPDLKRKPLENVQYSELPPAAAKSKNYTLWKKELKNWLLGTQKIELLRSPIFKEFSRAGETERDFRIRLQLIAREQRDKYTEKLRQKYASNFAKLDERIVRAQKILAKQEAIAKEKKYEAAVSIGATLLESMFGRKRIKGAEKTTRDIGRSVKKEQEKKSAQENLAGLQEERKNLEAQFQSEIQSLETKNKILSENLEKVLIKPSKTDVSIRLVALVWVPDWKDAQGKIVPAWK